MKPGPQDPNCDRHHDSSSHGSPVQECSLVSEVVEVSAEALLPRRVPPSDGVGVGADVIIIKSGESETRWATFSTS